MIPMWMCPGCGPFSLRRPACALSFGAATWSHDVSTVVWIRGIPKWTLLLSHPLPFSWLRTDGKIVGQTFRLLNYSDSYQANSETCHCQSFSSEPFIRSHHEISWENPWSTLCPGPVYSPFAHQLLCGSSFRHMCCHSSLCVHHAKKVSDRRRLKVWIGFNTIEICRFRRDLLVESPWVFVRSTVNQKTWSKNIIHVSRFFLQFPFLDSDS